MKVLRYTEEIQKAVGSKIKAEPWMHIVLSDDKYAVYVWDTRKILEAGKSRTEYAKIEGMAAKDSHKPLQGEHADAFQFSKNSAAIDDKQNYIAFGGYRWYGRGDVGLSANGKLVHSIDKADKMASNNGHVFNWADAKDITATFAEGVLNRAKKYGKSTNEFIDKFSKELGNCKIYKIDKPVATANKKTDFGHKLEPNYSDSTMPPSTMRFFSTAGYSPADCYCISDGTKLSLIVNAFDPFRLRRDYKLK